MQFGLEKEFFLLEGDTPQPVIGTRQRLPYDECGWLVEARGKPFSSIVEAVFSLKAAIYQIEQTLEDINAERVAKNQLPLVLSDMPFCKVDKATRIACARSYAKPLLKYQNFYGHLSHRNSQTEGTAGIHISLTEQHTIWLEHHPPSHYNCNFDWPRIFVGLDKAFDAEIKAAKRRPGFYELKADGRVEYRSLPANVSLDKVIQVIQYVTKWSPETYNCDCEGGG